ncbi:hypothetical protein Bbelb_064610 [Branchiostoma belcheri]|nr:hypothetical protein Bbelb_064610 [Branchiostoma belcheri]
MRRKLRHLLVFLLIILEELNTPAADQSWLVSDKPEISGSNESSPLSPSRLVLIGSMFGVMPGTALIVTILLTAWYKRKTKEGLNHNAIEGPTSTNGHNQTGQGQYQAITESNTNTTAAVVTSDHIPTGQGQSQVNTKSNTNTTLTAAVTSGHNQPGQGQYQTIIESNANTTTTVVTSDHIPTGQGQDPNITKFLDAGTKLYGTESTASQLNSRTKTNMIRQGRTSI